MKKLLRLSLITATALILFPVFASAATSLKIHVSILPQKYLVHRIAGDLAEVEVLVTPGGSPATYSPSPSQIKSLLQANIYFRIGVPFENGLMTKIQSAAEKTKIVDCRNGIILREMKAHVHDEPEEESHGHDDGHHEEEMDHHDGDHDEKMDLHDHSGKDPHTWMSPRLVKIQADTIFKALADIDPENADTYKKNHQHLIRDLDDLDRRLTTILKPYHGQHLFVFHPTFGYFADAYGMKQIAVEMMGKAPKGKELVRIIKLAKEENAKVIFVQPQFDKNTAGKIASAIGGHVVPIDPLAYDYLGNMEAVAKTVAKNLTP